MQKKSQRNTHMSSQIRDLHGAMLDIAAFINRPQQDEVMVQKAGISLDRALFPLLMGIERVGPIGVVELADRVGRDHSTVSRQVAKLETLGLIERCANTRDRRVREAVVSPKGKIMTDQVDAARIRMGREVLKAWDKEEISELVRLTRKFADAVTGE